MSPMTANAVAGLPHRLPVPVIHPPSGEWPSAAGSRCGPGGCDRGGALSLVPSPAQLSLDLKLESGAPHPPADLRILPAPTAAELDAVEAFCQRSPTSSALLPEPRSWCAAFVQGLLEVLAGTRAPQQLLRWCDEAVYADISRRVRAKSRRSTTTARPAMRSLHVSAPSDGAIEATAVIQVGRRCRAIAFRLDGLDGRWRASALEIL